MAADQSGSNNKDFDSYDGGLNSTVAPLANTWNPAYQAINTLNAALDRGPDAHGISAALKSSLLGEAHFLRALNYFTLVQQFGDVTLALHENKGVSAERGARSRGGCVQGDHRRSRFGVHHAPGDADRLRPGDEGRRADAAVQGLSHTRVQGLLAEQAGRLPVGAHRREGGHQLRHLFARAGVRGPVVRRTRPPTRVARGICENTGYNENRKEFIFTVQFGPNGLYAATNVDADNEYNYLHLIFLGQYDNNGLWAGNAARLEQRPSVPPPHADAVRAESLEQVRHHANDVTRARTTFSTRASTRRSRPSGSRRVGGVKNSAGSCVAGGATENCTSNGTVNVGDTAAVYYPFGVPRRSGRASRS